MPEQNLTQGENVVFRVGMPERAPSKRDAYGTLSGEAFGLLNVQFGAQNFWVYQGAQNSYVVEGDTHTDITLAAGLQQAANNYQISLVSLNGIPCLNNTVNAPMYWGGDVTTKFLALPGWPDGERAKVLVAFRFHLFAMNIEGATTLPSKVMWSDAAAPGNVPTTWVAAASNEAGSAQLSDTPGEIITAAPLRNELFIYKNGSTHAAVYVGPGQGPNDADNIFSFRTVFAEMGALTRHSVVDINGRHFVVTDGDVVIHDGVAFQSIVKNRRKRHLFGSLDQTNYQKLFVVFYRAKDEVWICYPESGQQLCTRAMIYDIGNDSWGDRELLPGVNMGAVGIVSDNVSTNVWDNIPDIWDTYNRIWDEQTYSLATRALVFSTAPYTDPQTFSTPTPRLWEIDSGDQSLRTALVRNGLDLGEPERFKMVKRVHVRVDASAEIELQVRVGGSVTADGEIQWAVMQPFKTRNGAGFVNCIVVGKFFHYEIIGQTEINWRLSALDLEYELRGYF